MPQKRDVMAVTRMPIPRLPRRRTCGHTGADVCEGTMTRLRDLMRREPRYGLALPAWLDRLLSVGIVTRDPQVARRQRCVNAAAYAGLVSGASYILLTSLYDLRGLLLLNVYNALLIVVGLTLPRLHRLGDNVAGLVLVLFIALGQLYVIWMLGITSDLHVFFVLAGATLFFFGIENWRLFLGVFVFAAALLLFALNFAPVDGLLLPTDGRLRDIVSSHTMMSVVLIYAAIIFYALTLLQRAEAELEQQHERSETLISTVMPAAIATRLKSGEERIADHIDNLSVVFADLVGFTTAAHDLPPEEIVGFLDGLVRSFDALAEEHGVEKIKTVGDCYMAAAGFDGRTREGAIAIARFALAMLEANADRAPLGSRKLDLRVGIHCGPATAGVIGDTRFSYDVWGAAVNAASRMESHGEAGRIQVSEAFRELTENAFAFEERGTVDVRGIGLTRTYFLVGPRAE
jgi:adenylate cyclase